MDAMMQLLKELTEAHGASGYEGPVRTLMRRYLEPVSEIEGDNLGSIIARRIGVPDGPRIALAAHLDEIGLLVTRITDDGFLKFQPLGGWWDHVLLGTRVEVMTRQGSIIGVIGAKPPHILSNDERNRLVDKKSMYIDIGASSREEAMAWGVRPGDSVVPVGPFLPMRNPDLFMAKALDNRVGCAIVVETIRRLVNERHPNIVYGIGNVQEEVGLRGAATTTYLVKPDIGFAIDTAIAGDMPGVGADDAMSRLGQGPAILLIDGSLIAHTALRHLVIDVAAEEGIPLQFDLMPGGGTDGGRMHIFGSGVPTVVIGPPVRYIHSTSAIVHRRDIEQTVQLLLALVRRLDGETVRRLQKEA
ncbi:MAG: M42 family metallopeptidase [Chloroflexus sp.]|uniref:M42 family metallopeptidase n=1 Tax=Chloroflexus sp. MS-CIW-1 TaxID=3055768 RepID=UPI001B2987C5|nr:M42 family metallopeptidase [Chloroflexus sp.]MBO9315028.1 M42 family metallopeptidase [Chloroflexus sp.]MBO9319283.1 M42 family metallopeptidase [Chloroflexus sp.]MBO9337234.1 M42 family metallopeptidase [Chloroflexus sp.]MBO9348600.1 M42 family metallopeptidase [Chloroflexus sp.]